MKKKTDPMKGKYFFPSFAPRSWIDMSFRTNSVSASTPPARCPLGTSAARFTARYMMIMSSRIATVIQKM